MNNIRLLQKHITNQQYWRIITHYNACRNIGMTPIQKISGNDGFQIYLKDNEIYKNTSIYQGSYYNEYNNFNLTKSMKLNGNILTNWGGIPFTDEENELLYNCLQKVLGDNKIEWVN
jgi:hypothetical protein